MYLYGGGGKLITGGREKGKRRLLWSVHNVSLIHGEKGEKVFVQTPSSLACSHFTL
jgi:hypothetical protein